MGATHGEILRLLPQLLKIYSWQQEDSCIIVLGDTFELRITLKPQRQRHIASLQLPVTDIEFDFIKASDEQIDKFMTFFDQVYRRGGG